jgi:hypothetical protein
MGEVRNVYKISLQKREEKRPLGAMFDEKINVTCYVYLIICSSISIVSDYRLDEWGLIPSRGKGKGFFL